jgi:type IV pilus assembly protein PilY1
VIYVGANDGMLHAFDAATGRERFAYVPNLIFDKLPDLASKTYGHRIYVDLTPTVATGVTLNSGADKTLLVGGLGGGGKGYFALDVTGADAVTSENGAAPAGLASRVLWEFTEADMGYSFSRPVIVKSNSPSCKWVVVAGNGYNSAGEKSVLYILDPKTGALIRKMEVGGAPGNGLSSPVPLDADFDEKVDFIYAGDLMGNIWKFDLRDPDPANWRAAFQDPAGSTPAPLFQARGPDGQPQPITIRPDIMQHPSGTGYTVCFGTGKFLGEEDITDNSVQSVYGVWDYGDSNYCPVTKAWTPADRTEHLGAFNRSPSPSLSNQTQATLLRQELKDSLLNLGGRNVWVRTLSATQPDWATAADPQGAAEKPNPTHHAGYYFDLPAGERVISDVIIRGGVLMAIGFRLSSNTCGNGGTSMFMEINAFTGGSLAGYLFDINRDSKVDANDLVKVDLNGDGIPEQVPPCGILLPGSIQPPVIQRVSNQLERKYFSSSSGAVEELAEIPPKLGLVFWMDVRR